MKTLMTAFAVVLAMYFNYLVVKSHPEIYGPIFLHGGQR